MTDNNTAPHSPTHADRRSTAGGGAGGAMTADQYYKQGNAYRQKGDWQHAIDCYLEAISLDPDSPAVQAKQMLDSILNYYCKDIYNP